MKILMAMEYKGYKVYVRMIDDDLFIWDAVYDNELYSNYIIITPKEGEKLADDTIAQAKDMCFAGAAATIDTKLKVELSDKDKENVEIFEEAREKVKTLES